MLALALPLLLAAAPAMDLPVLTDSGKKALASATHLVLVRPTQWDSTDAKLEVFRRDKEGWKSVLGSLPARVGRSGSAWGTGLSQPPPASSDPVKAEGDGRAPAGLFAVGQVRGYAAGPPPGIKLPYAPSTERSFCVDDGQSPLYNQLVELPAGDKKSWSSAEELKRKDGLYELLLTVDHNALLQPGQARPGAGSCIFLHVWRAPDKPTAGCTALSRQAMIRVRSVLPSTETTLFALIPDPAFARAAPALQLDIAK
jgi:L,D-peptidoglycan transpeptidase YkuD (ErfK/YbiS/YcfS/YnhG family)